MRQLSAIAALATTTTLFGSFAAIAQGVPGIPRLDDLRGRPGATAERPPVNAGWPAGYLAKPLADSMVLSPPPPAAGSAADSRDQEANRAALASRGSARWSLATLDADLFSPAATGAFSCAAGFLISPQTTPKLDRLLRRVARDLAAATVETKDKYARPRPFMVNGQPTCTPEAEKSLRGNGSYPSGHSAIGFGWGLVLAELVPERTAAIVARGRAFGDSRRICNVHWLSDTEEGRVAAAATVARLHAEPSFRADMADAAEELANARRAPQRCAEEAAALAG